MLSFFLVFVRLGRAILRCWNQPAFRGTLILAGVTALSGTLFYRRVEGWSWVDAAYFSVITLTTVGYGDLHPLTDAGKIFTMGYVLVGIGVFVALVTQIAEALLKTPEED
jgi:voltage-gated potassium channel Kch